MAHLVAAEIVVPTTLDDSSKRQLIDSLYSVHARIFDGVDKKVFAKYVVDSTAEHTSIQVYRREDGRIVGYCALHVFEREIRGEKASIVRGETGILRAYRGGNLVGGFMANRIIQYKLRNPGRKLYYVGSLVHPSSYTQLVRYVDEVWPREGAVIPADVQALMDEMAEEFGLSRVDEENPLVRKVGWKTIDSAADRAYWRRSDRPGVQFFLQANPGYADGDGLLTLAELSLGSLLQGFGRSVSVRASKQTQRMTERLRAGLRALLPAPAPAV